MTTTLLKKLTQYNNLNKKEIQTFVDIMMNEDEDQAIKTAYLIALSMKGTTSEELKDLAESLINTTYSTRPYIKDSICVCGTGGDHSNSFNISTTVSFIVAAAGLNVLKHGNKSITSKTGSVDILTALNINTTPVKQISEHFKHTNIAFLSAMETYPIMKTIQPVRRKINIPTSFNIIGPLIHPYCLDYQVMGVYDKEKLQIIAEALLKMGRKHAIVLHGAGGMDEASLSGDNEIYEIHEELGISHYTINAKDYGLQIADNEALKGGDLYENMHITLNILSGKELGPKRDVVVLNAALALYVGEKARTIEEGVFLAQTLLDSKKPLNILEHMGGQIYDYIR